jgi:hypothetical protein
MTATDPDEARGLDAGNRRSVGIRADPVSNGSPHATGCETQIRPKGEGQ